MPGSREQGSHMVMPELCRPSACHGERVGTFGGNSPEVRPRQRLEGWVVQAGRAQMSS